jgi:hypothetical protein
MKRKLIVRANVWCEECNDSYDVKLIVLPDERDPMDAAPQFYIEGLHIHVFGKKIKLDPWMCIWINDKQQKKFLKLAEEMKRRLDKW